jgi:GAF domain-containing protein
MSQFSKWKTIGYAAAIFATGGISGGALGVYETKSHLFEPLRQQEIAVLIKHRLQTRLHLTPDQVAHIDPIIDSAAVEIRAARMQTAERINKIFDDTYAKFAAILTPDQLAKLRQMEKERRDMMQARLLGEGHRHVEPGDSPSGSPAPSAP